MGGPLRVPTGRPVVSVCHNLYKAVSEKAAIKKKRKALMVSFHHSSGPKKGICDVHHFANDTIS